MKVIRFFILSGVLLLHGLWAMQDEKPEFSISGDIKSVNFISGEKLLIVTNHNTAAVYDIDEHRQLHTFDHVHGIELSPDARRIAIAAHQGAAIIDAQTYEIKTRINEKRKFGRMRFSPNNRYLADLEEMKLWTKSGAEVETLDCLSGRRPMAFTSQNNKTYVAMPHGNAVVIRRVKTARVQHTLQHDEDSPLGFSVVLSIAYNKEGNLLATGSVLGVRVWDPQTGHALLSKFNYFGVGHVLFSPDSDYLACMVDEGRNAVLIDLNTGEELWKKEHEVKKFSPNGKYIAVVALGTPALDHAIAERSEYSTSYAKILEVKTGKTVRNFEHNARIEDVAFSPDGKLFVTTDTNDGVKVWNIQDLAIE